MKQQIKNLVISESILQHPAVGRARPTPCHLQPKQCLLHGVPSPPSLESKASSTRNPPALQLQPQGVSSPSLWNCTTFPQFPPAVPTKQPVDYHQTVYPRWPDHEGYCVCCLQTMFQNQSLDAASIFKALQFRNLPTSRLSSSGSFPPGGSPVSEPSHLDALHLRNLPTSRLSSFGTIPPRASPTSEAPVHRGSPSPVPAHLHQVLLLFQSQRAWMSRVLGKTFVEQPPLHRVC